MQLFAIPPETRFDLRFSLAKIPVRVHPFFWIMAVLMGSSSGNLLQLLVWVVVVFVSILVHELGHAFAMHRYHQLSRIVLYLGGGLTIPEPVWWGSRWLNVSLGPMEEIVISLAGPLAGFFFAGIVILAAVALGGSATIGLWFGFLPLPMVWLPAGGWVANEIVSALIWVNVFWGLINLMPVQPLDGGNVARHMLVKIDPWGGVQKSLWVSVIAGGLVAILGIFLFKSMYIIFLFASLAVQSYQSLKGRFMQ